MPEAPSPPPDIAALIRPGDTVMWGQADAEPLPLTRALMAQRHRIGGRIRAFVGMSLADTVSPAHADCIDFASYCGAGHNRALARAGLLDIWPWHYSELAARVDRMITIAHPDWRARLAHSVTL